MGFFMAAVPFNLIPFMFSFITFIQDAQVAAEPNLVLFFFLSATTKPLQIKKINPVNSKAFIRRGGCFANGLLHPSLGFHSLPSYIPTLLLLLFTAHVSL